MNALNDTFSTETQLLKSNKTRKQVHAPQKGSGPSIRLEIWSFQLVVDLITREVNHSKIAFSPSIGHNLSLH